MEKIVDNIEYIDTEEHKFIYKMMTYNYNKIKKKHNKEGTKTPGPLENNITTVSMKEERTYSFYFIFS